MRLVTAVLVGLSLWVGTALAHGMELWAELIDGDVVVESFFSDGTTPDGATVEVWDGNGEPIASGETDANGTFSFPMPDATPVRIQVELNDHFASLYFTP